MILLQKLKWIVLSAVSVAMTALAVVYGKKTADVFKANLGGVGAKENMIKLEISAEEAKRKRAMGKADTKIHLEKVEKLETRLQVVQATKKKVLSESQADLLKSDDDLAYLDNTRRRKRSPN